MTANESTSANYESFCKPRGIIPGLFSCLFCPAWARKRRVRPRDGGFAEFFLAVEEIFLK